MDGRAFGSGFSSWRGGSSMRGSGDFDLYGSKDSMSRRGSFGDEGYDGGGGPMNRRLSGSPFISPSRTRADDLISKINQQLDVLTQLEGSMNRRGRMDRFDQYESVDSRSSALGPRDLYRSSNYGYDDSWGEMTAQREGVGFGPMGGPGDGGDFDSSASFRSAKMWQARDAFSGSGWGAGQRSPHRGGAPGGYGFGGRQDSFSVGGGGGRKGGQDKLPSLLAHRVYPTSGAFQPQRGSQDYPDRHFGGGRRANRQRSRKKPLKQQVKSQQDGQKKRKHSETATDEPDSKMAKTETAGDKTSDAGPANQDEDTKETEAANTASETAAEGKSSALSAEEELSQLKEKLHKKTVPTSAKSDNADQTDESKQAGASATQDTNPEAEGQSSALSIEEELSQLKAKLQGKQISDEIKPKKRRGFFEMSGVKITARRISFVCSVCKFRSFYSEDMAAHLESQFHKDVFKFLASRLSKRTMDFLQEYLNVKHKNMEKTVSRIMNHSAAICQLYKEQDLTRDIEMEHFMKKVEAAHCAACDLYFPMQYSLIQKHLKSPDHNYNRKRMMEECKKSGLTVARSILNHKPIQQKLEHYLKGENPFADEPDDQDLEDSMVIEAPEANPTSEKPEVKQEEEESAGSFPAEEALGKPVEQEKQEEHEQEEHEEPKIKLKEGEGAEEIEGNQIKEEKVEEGDV
ncbi:A-kinase anchor protein 8-like isoform X1 [Colossoma macropomum]|uniref:A-kinase anchor protein 8-like isoform X1 n=1 Tax=Colossoma macropomum TaxID=42526 RepID=UPI001863BF94|nr:A-kinase anchor protein 8-like isoform X1 [Colossoma macropomum]